MSPTRWVDPDPPTTDTPQFTGQLLEASGPDPARVVALQAAVELYGHLYDRTKDTLLIEAVLITAAKFEQYLTGGESP